MRYSIDIDRSINALTHCLQIVNNAIDVWEWDITINAGGIDYGVYFNFDIDNKELEICNCPRYDDSLNLYEIIELINSNEEDADEE